MAGTAMSESVPEPIRRLEEILARIRCRFPGPPVEAIPWIRIKHPIHPTQMELAQGHGPRRVLWAEWTWLPPRLLRCLLTAAHLWLQLAFLRLRLRRPLSELKKQPFDLIAKTWAYPKDMLSGWNDFYYGDLQRRLLAKGVRLLLLTGKAENLGWPDLAKAGVSACEPHQVPELGLVPLTAPLRSVFLQFASSLRLLRAASEAREDFARRLLLKASGDCLSPAVTAISLFYWIGKQAVRLWHPKALISLYEGYGWEQCLWRGAQEEDPACRTVGYQHTILFPHNLALLHPGENGQRSRPDLLLCLGPRTEAMLRPGRPKSELLSFGTFRPLPAEGLGRPPRPDRKTVLVLPEGYQEEATLLFNLALQAARRLPDHRFILRAHPVLPFQAVRKHLVGNPAHLSNVRISQATAIEEDFSAASVALYRGSSSVLYGVLHGLKPLFASNGRLPEPDPLFEIGGWREQITSVEQLQEQLRRYARLEGQTAAVQWQPAADYVATYLVAVGEASLEQLLRKTGIREKELLPA